MINKKTNVYWPGQCEKKNLKSNWRLVGLASCPILHAVYSDTDKLRQYQRGCLSSESTVTNSNVRHEMITEEEILELLTWLKHVYWRGTRSRRVIIHVITFGSRIAHESYTVWVRGKHYLHSKLSSIIEWMFVKELPHTPTRTKKNQLILAVSIFSSNQYLLRLGHS